MDFSRHHIYRITGSQHERKYVSHSSECKVPTHPGYIHVYHVRAVMESSVESAAVSSLHCSHLAHLAAAAMLTTGLLCCLKLWSHTHTIQPLWRIYIHVFSLCTIQGDYNEKGRARLPLSSPKQNKKKTSRFALSPCFYGNTAGCETDRRQLGRSGATF